MRCPGRSTRSLAILQLLLIAVPTAQAQTAAADLFPEPFVIEHYVVQDDGDGSLYRAPTVKDHYGGSWIVSLRPDGSRLVVDFARHTLSEIRPGKGTYWVVTFDRYAQLQNELLDLEIGRRQGRDGEASRRARSEPELRVLELPVARSIATLDGAPASAARQPGVRHLRVDRADLPQSAVLDVWVDPSLRLTVRALEALEQFERQVTGVAAERLTGGVGPDRYLAAARRHAQGALPVRTRRPLVMTLQADSVSGAGAVEDITVNWRRIEALPSELLALPAGFQRAPHPLELTLEALRFERAAEQGPPR